MQTQTHYFTYMEQIRLSVVYISHNVGGISLKIKQQRNFGEDFVIQ